MKRLSIAALLFVLILSVSTAAQEPIVIEIGMAETWQQAGLDAMENILIPKFEAENPGIKVNMSIIGWGRDTLVTRYLGGTAPDAFQIGGDRVGTYVDMLLPIDRYVQGWSDLADFPAVLLEGQRVGGQLYGIPWSMPAFSLLYNVNLFDEAGLDRNQPPVTWDDFVAYGRQLTRFDAQGNMTQQGFATGNSYFDFAPWLYQAGGDFLNADRTSFIFADDPGLEATSFMRSLVQEHRITDVARSLGNVTEFRSGMEYRQASSLNVEELREVLDVFPPTRNVQQLQLVYANPWVISNTSPHADAAWKWIEFISRIDNMVEYVRAALIVGPRLSLVNYEPWASDPRYATVYANTALSKPMAFDSPHIDQVRRDYIQPALQRIMYQNAPDRKSVV